jgi:hypothetical protein
MKSKWRHPYVSIARGMKSLPSAHWCKIVFAFEQSSSLHVLSLSICCTITMQVGSTMTTSIKVQKPYLVIRISIHHQVWQRKRWETSLSKCVPLFKTIVVVVSWNVSWAIVRSFPQGHWSKWVPKLSMVWPHWHHERWATIGCGKPRQVCNVIRKWVDDKRNLGVIGQINNQASTPRPTHEQRHVCVISEGTFIQSEKKSCSYK